ncbi:(S)-2-haloacid dehalogenase 4A [compost metagenome]
MKIVVFDLDDTLYDEMTYVESGFHAVASYLSECLAVNAEDCLNTMLIELSRNGRGKVFDNTLLHYRIYSKGTVQECVRTYRSHTPQIQLYRDAQLTIERLFQQGIPMYIVTDGNKHVQLKKLKALGLYDLPGIKKCYISRRFGLKNEKPSPYCFDQICTKENVSPSNVVYIGDNPNKDFIGIKPLGFKTIRILRGSFAEIQKPVDYEADRTISTLDELWKGEIFNGV